MASTEHEHLRQSLMRLHAELASAPRVDPASRKLLREVLADIERVLQESPRSAVPVPSKADLSAGPGPSAPRLEALAVEFEAEHPTLAGSLRQLVDLLGRAGL